MSSSASGPSAWPWRRPARAGGTGANRLAGRITRLTYLGAQTEVAVEIAGGQSLLGLVAEPSPAPLAVGGQVALALSPDAFLLL